MMKAVKIDFDHLRPEEFEEHLAELFASAKGKVSEDPRLKRLYQEHPDCLALVLDLETIAEHARSLLEPTVDPSEKVWKNIQSKLKEETGSLDVDFEDDEEDGDRPLRT